MDLQTIRTKARRKLDETTTGNTNVTWSDNELNDYINDGYLYYWQWLLNAKHPGTVKTDTLDVVSGQASIALPSDYHQARLVEKVFNNATYPLVYNPRFDTVNYTAGTPILTSYGTVYTYDFLGQNLILQPTPQENVTDGIKITYQFYPTRLSDDTDEPDSAFPDFYHDLLVGYCVIQAKEKEEMIAGGGADTSPFIRSQEQREQMFKASIETPTQQRIYTQPWSTDWY